MIPNNFVQANSQLGALQTPSFSLAVYFIEPVVRSINFATGLKSHGLILMAGKSGGGWTTTMAGAIDTRIRHSYPIAGSMPIYTYAGSGRPFSAIGCSRQPTSGRAPTISTCTCSAPWRPIGRSNVASI